MHKALLRSHICQASEGRGHRPDGSHRARNHGRPRWLVASTGPAAPRTRYWARWPRQVVGSSTGSLSLEHGTSRVTGTLTDYAGTATALTQQTLVPSKSDCLLKGTENLLSVAGFVGTGTTDLASYANGSIGVAEKKTGTSCGQVGAATKEALVLSLGSRPAQQGAHRRSHPRRRAQAERRHPRRGLPQRQRGQPVDRHREGGDVQPVQRHLPPPGGSGRPHVHRIGGLRARLRGGRQLRMADREAG